MPAPKGNKFATGRPKGKQNAITIEFKEAVNNLIDFATPQMVDWLAEIEDPSKRLDHIYKFAQFGYPLLSRAEQNVNHKGQINIVAGRYDDDI